MPPPARRPPPTKTAAPLVGISVLVIILAAIGFIYLQTGSGGAEEQPEIDALDPFADLPPEAPPDPRNRGKPAPAATSAAAEDPFGAAAGDDPFAGLGGVTDDELWRDAVAKAGRARALVEEATAALEEGDRATSQAKGAEAQRLLTEALEETHDWEDEVGRRVGFDDPQYKRVARTRTGWRRDVTALKKSSGL